MDFGERFGDVFSVAKAADLVCLAMPHEPIVGAKPGMGDPDTVLSPIVVAIYDARSG